MVLKGDEGIKDQFWSGCSQQTRAIWWLVSQNFWSRGSEIRVGLALSLIRKQKWLKVWLLVAFTVAVQPCLCSIRKKFPLLVTLIMLALFVYCWKHQIFLGTLQSLSARQILISSVVNCAAFALLNRCAHLEPELRCSGKQMPISISMAVLLLCLSS